MTKSLEQYLSDAMDRGVIDHALRAHRGLDGKVTFYIHPSGVDGETLDFVVRGNAMVPNVCSTSDVPAAGAEDHPHEVQSYVCVGGPLDGQTLIYRGAVFHVTRNGPAPAAAHDGRAMPPRHPAIETAAYHLYRDDAGQKFWKFGGWPT